MTQKPVIIGMNNPLSDDPRWALAPYPKNSAGWNLWKMLNDVDQTSRIVYMNTFHRVNAHNSKNFDAIQARERCKTLWDDLRGRTVVVLGQLARKALWLPPSSPATLNTDRGVTWYYAPHPSGLNREYNDEMLRFRVGLLLSELKDEYHADISSVP